MNASIKSSLINPKSTFLHIKSIFFHSTTVLERGRRNKWNSRFNKSNDNRWTSHRRNRFKDNIMRDPNAFVERLFKTWNSDYDQDEQASDKGPSWFREPHNGSGRNSSNSQRRHKKGRREYSFCEDDDDDVETIFRSAFGDQFIFWSFINDDYPNRTNSSRYSNNHHKTSGKWRQQIDEDDDFEFDFAFDFEFDEDENTSENTKKSDLASERIALGLSTSGPLKLDDVKNAYRACALKWHPDRHLGSSKAAAEEKFKLCTAAYQSLCDRLATN